MPSTGDNVLTATVAAPKVLYSGQLANTTDNSLYSPAAGKSAVIKHATVCNTTGGAVTVTVRVVPSGGSADGTHVILSGYSLAAGDTLPLSDYLEGCCLAPGDSIHAQAGTANAVDVVISGVENG